MSWELYTFFILSISCLQNLGSISYIIIWSVNGSTAELFSSFLDRFNHCLVDAKKLESTL